MTRLQATVALLQAWLDYVPWPETWTGQMQRRSTKSGPAPFRSILCSDCEGRGKTRSGWICSTCKGEGKLYLDDYTLERVESEERDESLADFTASFKRLVAAQYVNCDGCAGTGRASGWTDGGLGPNGYAKAIPWERDAPLCERCFGTGRQAGPFTGPFRNESGIDPGSATTGDGQLDALARNTERREALPIYRDHFLPALHALKEIDRYGHFLVEWVWILGAQSPESLPARGTVRLINGTRAIEAAMPDRFEKQLPGEIRAQFDHQEAMRSRYKGWAQAKGRGVNGKQFVRDAEVKKLWATGSWTQAQLAEKFGVNQPTISKILKKTG